ncbi:hypothetical protein [Endomicrobium proavitum]|uniref:Lipoprotein n=1 Tax=Endomicrobium proavitum TaxID=1408281 RepID=A0A0G3WIB7_9BACT|nr:hypothetical protein [Endomicrobium proavitum]AKL98426.1 hypothetical protein Epro_1047 [Endomicrobium proavitum]
MKNKIAIYCLSFFMTFIGCSEKTIIGSSTFENSVVKARIDFNGIEQTYVNEKKLFIVRGVLYYCFFSPSIANNNFYVSYADKNSPVYVDSIASVIPEWIYADVETRREFKVEVAINIFVEDENIDLTKLKFFYGRSEGDLKYGIRYRSVHVITSSKNV